MIDKVVLTSNKKEAKIVYENGKTFNLFSDGNVLDLLTFFLIPSANPICNFRNLTNSIEDTIITEIL